MLRFGVITEFNNSAADVLFITNVLSDLDCILTGLISKACWSFANEKDLTHIILYPSIQTP